MAVVSATSRQCLAEPVSGARVVGPNNTAAPASDDSRTSVMYKQTVILY